MLLIKENRVPTRPGKPGKPGKMRVHLENLEKSWKYHGILSVRKSGNPGKITKKIQ